MFIFQVRGKGNKNFRARARKFKFFCKFAVGKIPGTSPGMTEGQRPLVISTKVRRTAWRNLFANKNKL